MNNNTNLYSSRCFTDTWILFITQLIMMLFHSLLVSILPYSLETTTVYLASVVMFAPSIVISAAMLLVMMFNYCNLSESEGQVIADLSLWNFVLGAILYMIPSIIPSIAELSFLILFCGSCLLPFVLKLGLGIIIQLFSSDSDYTEAATAHFHDTNAHDIYHAAEPVPQPPSQPLANPNPNQERAQRLIHENKITDELLTDMNFTDPISMEVMLQPTRVLTDRDFDINGRLVLIDRENTHRFDLQTITEIFAASTNPVNPLTRQLIRNKTHLTEETLLSGSNIPHFCRIGDVIKDYAYERFIAAELNNNDDLATRQTRLQARQAIWAQQQQQQAAVKTTRRR